MRDRRRRALHHGRQLRGAVQPRVLVVPSRAAPGGVRPGGGAEGDRGDPRSLRGPRDGGRVQHARVVPDGHQLHHRGGPVRAAEIRRAATASSRTRTSATTCATRSSRTWASRTTSRRCRLADATINGWLADINARVVWTFDGTFDGPEHRILLPGEDADHGRCVRAPTRTQFVFLDGGTLDLGTDIHDSLLNATNDRQAFAESFEKTCFRVLRVRVRHPRVLQLAAAAPRAAPCRSKGLTHGNPGPKPDQCHEPRGSGWPPPGAARYHPGENAGSASRNRVSCPPRWASARPVSTSSPPGGRHGHVPTRVPDHCRSPAPRSAGSTCRTSRPRTWTRPPTGHWPASY